jgi:hypothetical protein
MIYFRTLFSAPSEIKFLKLNLAESFDYIDRFIICEFNRTHIGTKRELIFEKYIDLFTEQERKKILYIGADVSELIIDAKNNPDLAHHHNEKIIRGYFASQVDLNDEDIVFSVDADEIVFRQYYEPIIQRLNNTSWPFTKSILLPMFQFYYRINYLWKNLTSTHAVACKASVFNKKYPSHWREKGRKYPKIVGCHFSWCLTIDEMIQKLGMYAHHHEYAHLAKREILEDAVRNKKYPFDPKRDFRIQVLDIYKDTKHYPQSIYTMLDEFKYLIGE